MVYYSHYQKALQFLNAVAELFEAAKLAHHQPSREAGLLSRSNNPSQATLWTPPIAQTMAGSAANAKALRHGTFTKYARAVIPETLTFAAQQSFSGRYRTMHHQRAGLRRLVNKVQRRK